MPTPSHSPHTSATMAPSHRRGLAELVDALRRHAQTAQEQSRLAREIQQLHAAARMLEVGKPGRAKAAEAARDLALQREHALHAHTRALLAQRSAQPSNDAGEPDDGEWVWRAFRQSSPGYAHALGAEPAQLGAVVRGFEAVLARLATGQPIDEAVAQLSLALGPDAGAAQDVLNRVIRRLIEHWEALVLAELDAIANEHHRTP